MNIDCFNNKKIIKPIDTDNISNDILFKYIIKSNSKVT